MTPPADFAALRKLVEAVATLRQNLLATCHDGVPVWSWYDEDTKAVDTALPTAREALERVEANSWLAYKEDMATVKQEHWLRIQALQARLARLEQSIDWALKALSLLALDHSAVARPVANIAGGLESALEGRPHAAEWHRVHGPVIQGDAAVTSEASAQAARDVAHWRTRAEHAEARLARLNGALEELLSHYRDAPFDVVRRARAVLEGRYDS